MFATSDLRVARALRTESNAFVAKWSWNGGGGGGGDAKIPAAGVAKESKCWERRRLEMGQSYMARRRWRCEENESVVGVLYGRGEKN